MEFSQGCRALKGRAGIEPWVVLGSRSRFMQRITSSGIYFRKVGVPGESDFAAPRVFKQTEEVMQAWMVPWGSERQVGCWACSLLTSLLTLKFP